MAPVGAADRGGLDHVRRREDEVETGEIGAEQHRVGRAGAAVEVVVAEAAGQAVVAGVAPEAVVGVVADDLVVAGPAPGVLDDRVEGDGQVVGQIEVGEAALGQRQREVPGQARAVELVDAAGVPDGLAAAEIVGEVVDRVARVGRLIGAVEMLQGGDVVDREGLDVEVRDPVVGHHRVELVVLAGRQVRVAVEGVLEAQRMADLVQDDGVLLVAGLQARVVPVAGVDEDVAREAPGAGAVGVVGGADHAAGEVLVGEHDLGALRVGDLGEADVGQLLDVGHGLAQALVVLHRVGREAAVVGGLTLGDREGQLDRRLQGLAGVPAIAAGQGIDVVLCHRRLLRPRMARFPGGDRRPLARRALITSRS